MTDKQKNYIRAKEIEQKNKERIKQLCPTVQDRAGIYLFWRQKEDGTRVNYIGKSETSVWTRCAQHLNGYKQHLDLSIREHGLYSVENPHGWHLGVLTYCHSQECDARERAWIAEFREGNAILYNVESGGTIGKTDINERKPARGYRDGVKQGERNVIKKIAHLFDLHLKAVYKADKADKPSKNAEKALQTFLELIGDNPDEH